MTIGIVGAGFTGLSLALRLSKKGHKVFIFEKENLPGGLAGGFKEKGWDWTLERHYHHFFTNDRSLLNLAKEVNQKILVIRPKTSTLINGGIYQLDSPLTLIKFPLLNFFQKARMGFAIMIFRYNPYWKMFEKYKAYPFLSKLMGQRGFNLIWAPLFKNKLGKYMNTVSAAWFWARIKKRTTSLAYPEAGYLEFANKIAKEIEKNGGKLFYETELIYLEGGIRPKIIVENKSGKKKYSFDKIIFTAATSSLIKTAKKLPLTYIKKAAEIKSLGATSLVLRLRNQYLEEGTYWLNVCDEKSPIMAIIEHTNFIDKKNYGGEHVVYVSNYPERESDLFRMDSTELFKIYEPYLKSLNPNFKKGLISYRLFKDPFAQPVIPDSKAILPFKTPLRNILLANMEQVYPWDRGVNYAVQLAEEVSKIVEDEC